MPNYSHGNKLTVAAVDEPPYLTVGTDVSAKYKGAFCEAKIIDVNKHVKLKVLFDGHPGIYMIDDTELKQGTVLELGSKIEARHPEKKQQVYTHATITKILDQSRYTVVFDDGDQCILRRNSICLKSGKHFAESETLDQLPLTNPEHFGNPVKVGQASLEQNNHNNSTNNQQQVANQSTNRLNNNINNNNSNSSSTSGGSSKNGFVDFNNQASSTTSNNGKAQNNVKLETDRPNKGKSISSASSSSNANNTSSTATLSSGASGRRGSAKGRKRSESTTINSKQTSELEDELGDDSQDSADVDPGESDVNFELIEIGVKLMVQYGKGKVQNVYEAKVNKMETNSSGRTRYFVHYTGWNNRYDEWITKSRILNIVSDKEGSSKDGRSKQPEPNSTSAATNASPTTSSDSNTNRDSMVNKEKEKEKDVKVAAKTPRRSRQVDPASSATAVTVPNSTTASSVPSATAASTTTVAKPTLASTSSQDKEKERVKEKEKDVNPIARTPRRSRQVDAALAPVPALSTSNAASTPTVPVVAPASSVAVSKPTVSSAPSHDKEKDKERVKEKDANLMVRTPRRSRQVDAASIAPAVATSNSTSATSVPAPTPTATAADIKPNATSAPSQDKDTERVKEREKEKVREKDREKIREKEREKVREREREREKAREKEKERAKEKEKEREKLKEKERERAREKEKEKTEEKDLDRQEDKCPAIAPSLKSGRPRLSDALSSSPCADKTPIPPTDDKEREPPTSPSKDTNATITTNDATTTTIITTTTSAASSTSSIASSSSSPSYSLASTNPALSVLATLSEKEIEKFIIDEPDCDKRISILQDKIMSIRQTYKTLKAELADLDRRRKRPRLERGYVSELTKVMFT